MDITISYAGGAASRVRGENKPFNDLSVDAIDWGIDVNFKGPIYMARADPSAVPKARPFNKKAA